MRAVIVREFGPIENAVLGEAPDPKPGPRDVLVEIHATAANYVDILLIGGLHQSRPTLPFIPGKGPAGIVRSIGNDVAGLSPGDRVVAMCEPGGGYAELVSVPANQCHRIPDAMPFEAAASMALIYDTAWFALRERGRYQPGESVLVLGASGGVGLATIQLAKALGAHVLAGVSNPDKFHLASEAGADTIIELDGPDLRNSLRDQVFAATGGHGADIVIDPLGDIYFEAALRALAWCGRLVVVGFAAGSIPSVKANYLLVKNIEVAGLQIGDYRKRAPEKTAVCFKELFALYEAGEIGPLATTTMLLENVQDALRAIRERTALGRMVLIQDDEPQA
ncbi:MAG: NADPH:quinone oxidoreductase family protein [Rhodospirillaceae bacterium]|jgi:NADPH:quinone reductase|nr:NADPH:quinone oxidoreductase family protein [Rhodospirillaceae bacterium]